MHEEQMHDGSDRLATIEEKIDALLARSHVPDGRFIGVEAAAVYSGLSAESIRRLVAAGKLVGYRPVPGRVLIDRRELDSVILGSRRQPANGRGSHRRGE